MATAKAPTAILKKPKKGEKSYTKTQLIAHLTEAVNKRDIGEVSKKQAAALVEELGDVVMKYAGVGATIPGIGKLVVRETPARKAQTRVIFGEERKVPAKKAGRKLVFRIAKAAKDEWNK